VLTFQRLHSINLSSYLTENTLCPKITRYHSIAAEVSSLLKVSVSRSVIVTDVSKDRSVFTFRINSP